MLLSVRDILRLEFFTVKGIYFSFCGGDGMLQMYHSGWKLTHITVHILGFNLLFMSCYNVTHVD
jgi:hypothetical protein